MLSSDPLRRHPDLSEARRLAVLEALELLDSEPEREFDALVALAAEMLGCPTALLTLVDRDRLWIKAAIGSETTEVPREYAFCDHTIRDDVPLIIPDTAADARFEGNPLVDEHGLRFYAGAPIHATDGEGGRHAIGALCVVDTTPRSLNDSGRAALTHLATIAEVVIAARGAASRAIALAKTSEQQAGELERQERVFQQAERIAMIGSWRLNLLDSQASWSDGVYRIHGLPVGAMPELDEALAYYPPAARVLLTEALNVTATTGAPIDLELDFVRANGDARRVRVMGEREDIDGAPDSIVGIFQDVTDRHALETSLRRSANTDALTGLANRAAFDRALEAAVTAAITARTPLALALIDLDGFKLVNDTLGHGAGDDVLRTVGRRLGAAWLEGCVVARIGGDEFAVIVDDPALVGDPERLQRELEEALKVSVRASGLTMTCAGTVGVGLLPEDCTGVRDFMHRVDTILYAAKRRRVGGRRSTDRKRAA